MKNANGISHGGIHRFKEKILNYLRQPLETKLMMFEAVYYSAKYRYIITHKEFRDYAESIGEYRYETPAIRINNPVIKHCEWAVHAACKRVPWDSKCLDQALAAKRMLNKRGLPCTMYMGVIQNEKKEMTAHAWLRCGVYPVTGGNGQGYAVTGFYGDREEECKK